MHSDGSSIPRFDLEHLRAFAQTFEELFYADDGDAMAAYYTDNAWLAGEGINAMSGIDNIRVFWENACERGKQLGMKRSLAIASCEMSGELGYAISTATLDFTPPGAAPRPLAVKEVARIGVQVADALAYAHAHGVLHRDIKPSNLLLDEAGAVWVTDFGVAKLMEEANLTQSGDVVGTLRYMPPERFAGKSDGRNGAGLQRSLPCHVVAVSSQNDRGNSGAHARQASEEPEAIHSGHPEIEHQTTGLL